MHLTMYMAVSCVQKKRGFVSQATCGTIQSNNGVWGHIDKSIYLPSCVKFGIRIGSDWTKMGQISDHFRAKCT